MVTDGTVFTTTILSITIHGVTVPGVITIPGMPDTVMDITTMDGVAIMVGVIPAITMAIGEEIIMETGEVEQVTTVVS